MLKIKHGQRVKVRSIVAAGWLGCMALLPLGATAQEEDGDLLATAFAAVNGSDWVTADHYAEQMSNPIGKTLVTWQRLRRGEGHWEEYVEFLAQNLDWPGLKRPRRRGFARRAMRMGETDLAYWLASQHGLSSGGDYADPEWVAGFISLTKLNAPDQAVIHFRNHMREVKTPVSLGRAEEKRADFDAAVDAFNLGAKYQTSFYGQWAAEKIGANPDVRLTGTMDVPDWRDGPLAASTVVQAGILLHHAQE